MKFLLVLILFLIPNVSFSKNVTPESFRYSKVYQCGPKKWDDFKETYMGLYHYFFIHFDQYNNVVILHNGEQFKSFEKTSLSHLFYQNGGELTLNFKNQGSNYIFSLIKTRNNKVWTRTLIFDESNLTYQTRMILLNTETQKKRMFQPESGFCLQDIPGEK